MLQAYLDDSGTHDGSPVVVVGGLIGLEKDWRNLEEQWLTKLAAPLPNKRPLKSFHLGPCVQRRGEFEDYSFAESEALRHDFRQIILGSNLYQLSLAIPKTDWDELIVPPYRNFLGTAEEACFFQFIEKSIELVRKFKTQKLQIAYVYDLGRESEHLARVARLFKESASRSEFHSFEWGKVGDMPRLQAADMIATESYWAVQNWIADGSVANADVHFQRLHNGMAGEGLILDREAIEAEISRRGPDGKLRN